MNRRTVNTISNSKGFTLIELLVAITIIGVLSAISLPGFLSQAAKARGSEAKSSLGTINRSQQTYRLINGTFAGQLTDLDVRVGGRFYTYLLGAATTTDASVDASALQSDLRSYSSAVKQNNDFFGQVICEGLSPNTPAGTATAPTMPAQSGSCAIGARVVN